MWTSISPCRTSVTKRRGPAPVPSFLYDPLSSCVAMVLKSMGVVMMS